MRRPSPCVLLPWILNRRHCCPNVIQEFRSAVVDLQGESIATYGQPARMAKCVLQLQGQISNYMLEMSPQLDEVYVTAGVIAHMIRRVATLHRRSYPFRILQKCPHLCSEILHQTCSLLKRGMARGSIIMSNLPSPLTSQNNQSIVPNLRSYTLWNAEPYKNLRSLSIAFYIYL